MGTDERMSPFKEWYEIQLMKVCGRGMKSNEIMSARSILFDCKTGFRQRTSEANDLVSHAIHLAGRAIDGLRRAAEH
jgi:hypothetical protein